MSYFKNNVWILPLCTFYFWWKFHAFRRFLNSTLSSNTYQKAAMMIFFRLDRWPPVRLKGVNEDCESIIICIIFCIDSYKYIGALNICLVEFIQIFIFIWIKLYELDFTRNNYVILYSSETYNKWIHSEISKYFKRVIL